MWNAMTGSLVCTFVLDRVPVTALAALTTGGDDPRTLVCAGTVGGTVYVWESEQEAVGGVPLSAQESGGSGARRNTVPKGALVSMMDHTETRVTCLAAISGGSGGGGGSRAREDDDEAGASGPAFTIFAATDDGVLRGSYCLQ
jgi:hypothetical protein